MLQLSGFASLVTLHTWWENIYGDGILLRAGCNLDSEVVADVLQSGPTQVLGSGVVRMPVQVFNPGSAALSGWVTVDTTSLGGPMPFQKVCATTLQTYMAWVILVEVY